MGKVLVIGSGGREHAIACAFKRNGHKTYVSPGNFGMVEDVILVPAMDFPATVEYVKANAIDLVFVGPEQPLSEGIADYLQENGIAVIGPSRAAARIESSKAFAKNLMQRYGIPTAAYRSFDRLEEADAYLKDSAYPQVIKADGLAAGKGVVIAQDYKEAKSALEAMMQDQVFGESGSRVVIEEFMRGWEASVFAFTDGENFVSTIFSQDHKPLLDGDKGPNTGGMGAYAPVKSAEKYRDEVNRKIFAPTLKAMREEGCPYKGVLYAGLMITDEGPKVVEFNCRFGDPETEVVLPLLKTDLFAISRAILDGKISKIDIEWEPAYAVTVVAASGGYPGKYEKNITIEFNDGLLRGDHHKIFFAGVKRQGQDLVTSGGRVMMVTAIAESLDLAREIAYRDIEKVRFANMQYRKDIGSKGY